MAAFNFSFMALASAKTGLKWWLPPLEFSRTTTEFWEFFAGVPWPLFPALSSVAAADSGSLVIVTCRGDAALETVT
eukprot:CAMPEP_0171139532 /NCGR_PEP_ID=MMETSP0766_2-20121228/137037_1 /TAXON_ID=439317 /ORGANISM="Gambierdiscus australes, Strain CAWD 149" /LENGTH=75 /DNA_ID=CAMNT_0011603195 /DNA_START=125 /DNA_END=352 /DNA_ORIENTATION=-